MRMKDSNMRFRFTTAVFEFPLRWSQDFGGSDCQRIIYN